MIRNMLRLTGIALVQVLTQSSTLWYALSLCNQLFDPTWVSISLPYQQ